MMQMTAVILLVTLTTYGVSVTSASHRSGSRDGVKEAFLDAHNAARRNVGVPDLKWDNELAKSAEKWASGCQFKHSRLGGENLAMSGARKDGDMEAVARYHVQLWVDEKQRYHDHGNWNCMNSYDKSTCLHYTQVVWKKTERVGCATAHCDKLPNYTVCHYDPPGNYKGVAPY